MKKYLKALSALILAWAVLLTARCTKDPDSNNGNTETTIPEVKLTEVVVDSTFVTTFRGAVISDGGDSITKCGFCWDTLPMPSIDGNHTIAELCEGSFFSEICDLESGIYYVRAYAINSNGIGYSDEVSFEPFSNGAGGENVNVPIGAIIGKFTINENGDQVYFSQGNLQYQASTNAWRFAENQWSYVGGTDDQSRTYGNVSGSTNNNISSTYSGWIDLFGWGTSGWDCGNTYYHPWDSNDGIYDNNLYGPIDSTGVFYDLDGRFSLSDWGVYNAIINGGNTVGQWRTLTSSELWYILDNRNTPSEMRFAKATVNEVRGLVLLPDNWSSDIYSLNNVNNKSGFFADNIINSTQWGVLQDAGAVFLPAAGLRSGKGYFHGWEGNYWEATGVFHIYGPTNTMAYACYVTFSDGCLQGWTHHERYLGFSVRLVCPAEK